MVYILSEAQKAKKAEQNSKRYYELKEIKLKNKELALAKKIQNEIDRKQKIKENKIYNFHHMKKYKPKTEVTKMNNDSDIILNDLIHDDSDSDSDIEPVPIMAMKYKFI